MNTKIINFVKHQLISHSTPKILDNIIDIYKKKITADILNKIASITKFTISSDEINFLEPRERYTAIIQTYQNIFPNLQTESVERIENLIGITGALLSKTHNGVLPKITISPGVYSKQLDRKTYIILVCDDNDFSHFAQDEERLTSRRTISLTQYIIGGNHSYWKKRIQKMNNINLEGSRSKNMTSSISSPSPMLNYMAISDPNGLIKRSTMMVRPMSCIVFPNKNEILDKIQNFTKNQELYTNASIPYKLGILLHGPSGTGKTSFASSLAHLLGGGLTVFHLNYFDNATSSLTVFNDITNEYAPMPRFNTNPAKLKSLGFISRNHVILIDEIDVQMADDVINTDEKPKIKTTRLVQLLKALDNTSMGQIIIATTNHFDWLDERLLRSGRFDFIYELTDLDRSHCEKLAKAKGIDDVEDFIAGKEFPYNPAKLEEDIMTHLIQKHGLSNTKKIDIDELVGKDAEEVSIS